MLQLKNMLLMLAGLAISTVVQAHEFTFKNNCGSPVKPVIVNVNCGYSPRCDTPTGGVPNPAISYTGPQPDTLAPGTSQTLTINAQWDGRIFDALSGNCGPKGESCTFGEFNLDTGSRYTPSVYDISNRQGFTQSIQIAVDTGDTVTCTNAECDCKSAYPPNGSPDCGFDPVRVCSAASHSWTVTFCP